MNPAIASSLAVELDRLATYLRRDSAWPSPATGFARWLAHHHSPTDPGPRPDSAGALIAADRLNEAPILAAYGYLLASENDPDHHAIAAWSDAARRLGERDPLPGDRASFFFRPTELLGLALGADAIVDHDPEPRRWLRQTLHTGRGRLGTDTWSVALNTLAATILGDTSGTGRVGSLADASAADLAAGWLLATRAPQAAASAGLDHDTRALETALLYRLTTTDTTTTDIAEAAAIHIAATAAISTGLARPGYGLPAALATIASLLRRFPAIVRELNNRHAGRAPLVDLADEYDVQDLLRGVLRGLFDDVRDEEYTPSRGGVTSRMDLLLKREQIVIETKMTRPSLDQRSVAKELAIDKEFYRAHPSCRTLICFVYDPTHRLTNPTALEDDLSDPDAPVSTIVIVAPHR
jgi:hypothetical protein